MDGINMAHLPQNPSEATKRRNPHVWAGVVAANEARTANAVPAASDFFAQKVSGQPKKLLRQSAKPLNKLELDFLARLVGQFGANNVFAQSISFKLGNGVRFLPDFVVFYAGFVRCYETKGWMRDDAAVKIKVAASKYPQIDWYLVWRNNNQFQEQRILP
jgi:hypothetical protein